MSLSATIRRALFLPAAVSTFERGYLARVNRVSFGFFTAHIPLLVVVALFNDTDPLLAFVLSTATLLGPGLMTLAAPDSPRAMSLMFGFVAMIMGGLLVHFGQGPLQIEMHFYFFALIAMCAIYGNPMVIVVAAATVSAHHLLLWGLLPRSVFNYDAPVWVVLVHAGFVLLESVASIFIARSFFDNVIGLERIVADRTQQLLDRNDEMRLVLENIDQGLVICDASLHLGSQRSAALGRWFKNPCGDFVDAVSEIDVGYAANLAAGWQQVRDGFLPLDVALAQLPGEIKRDDGGVLRTRFIPIGATELPDQMPERFLLVVSDETEARRQQRAADEGRDVVQALEHLLHDRAGFLEFVDEADELVEALEHQGDTIAIEQRLLHTLKGNAAVFGVDSVSSACEAAEDRLADDATTPLTDAEREAVVGCWRRWREKLAPMLVNAQAGDAANVSAEDVEALVAAIRTGETASALQQRVAAWSSERLSGRFLRIGEQARRLAERLDRGALVVEIDDGGVRLDARRFARFWGAFVHVIRNAVDHGLPPIGDDPLAAPPRLMLRSYTTSSQVVIEAADSGGGIDWTRVATRARERALPHTSRDDLVAALFADGLSTRDVATALSGRGVGLGAVRAVCNDLGGDVTVDSDGGGTCFRFTFPRFVAADDEARAQI